MSIAMGIEDIVSNGYCIGCGVCGVIMQRMREDFSMQTNVDMNCYVGD